MNWKTKIKNLFCFHKHGKVICWHYVKPLYGYYTTIIEVQLKCDKCGKYYFRYVYPNYFDEFVKQHKNKQWSDTCKQV